MRAQAMENLLIQFEEAVYKINKEYDLSMVVPINPGNPDCFQTLFNLCSKSAILRDRSDRSASVIRELVNK